MPVFGACFMAMLKKKIWVWNCIDGLKMICVALNNCWRQIDLKQYDYKMSLWEQIGQITYSATDVFKEVTSGVKGLHSPIL